MFDRRLKPYLNKKEAFIPVQYTALDQGCQSGACGPELARLDVQISPPEVSREKNIYIYIYLKKGKCRNFVGNIEKLTGVFNRM